MNYVFGYGSLICSDSRSRTGVTSEAHPIEVTGIARKWSMHSPEWPATAVSAHQDKNESCNGVYFEVDEANLSKFDEREQGYHRIAIDWKHVRSVSKTLPTEGTLWAYVGNESGRPTQQKPIMQSYLDVILNGCLDYGPHFAQRFTELTQQWDWLVNDRHEPQYPRALNSAERLPHIDNVVKKHLPTLWRDRRKFP